MIYHITTQTDELLSIVYESVLIFYDSGRVLGGKFYFEAYAIVIDLVNIVRLDLSQFVPIDLSKEDPKIDLYYRVLHSREIFETPRSHIYEGTDLESRIFAGLPYGITPVNNYMFFVTPETTYYIASSTTARGSYLFVKILDDAGDYQLPLG